ncbi:MAG: hypothetical protein KTR14_10065 [Vampirovibrio sp.]|nr:hypothetical protein [Vampirovibrio sp.]
MTETEKYVTTTTDVSGNEATQTCSQPVSQVIFKALLDYLRYFWPFTKVLILPLILLFAGKLAMVFLPTWTLDYILENHYRPGIEAWALLGSILLCLPGLCMLLYGAWKYLVYILSFNFNAAQVLQNQPPDFGQAYNQALEKKKPYTMLLLVLALIWIPPLIYFTALIVWMELFPSILNWVPLLLGGGAMLVVSIYFCLCFQLVAFEPELSNPFAILKRSMELVQTNVGQVAMLYGFVLLVLFSLIPSCLLWLLNTTGITGIFSLGMEFFVKDYLTKAAPSGFDALGPLQSYYQELFDSLLNQIPAIALELTRSMLYSFFSALMLGPSTLCFVHLYLNLRPQYSTEQLDSPIT